MSDFGFTVLSSGYDDEDRLVGWNRDDAALDQSWNLSLVGDWDSFTENTTTQNRTHGDAHEILTVASQSVEHDVKGNMTLLPSNLASRNSPLSLSWDFENKLETADVDDDQTDDIAYKWDALGRRIGRTHYFPLPPGEGQGEGSQTVIYFQSGQQTIADYPAGTAAASPTYTYVYASYIDEPVLRKGSGGDRFFHRNQQYSITALTDSNGSITERYAYTAYGELEILNAAGQLKTGTTDENRCTYTGREWDAGLGLYHFRARMCDSIMGRFCSKDPIGYKDGMNMSASYFAISGVDPAGKYYVECRGVRKAGLRWLTHCQLERECTPGPATGPNGEPEEVACHRVGMSNDCDRKLWIEGGRTKSCCEATGQVILSCLKKYKSGASLESRPGSNCQSDTIESLGRCCLESTWRPSWYAYGSGICLKGHWGNVAVSAGVGAPGVLVRKWICDVRLSDIDWNVEASPMQEVGTDLCWLARWYAKALYRVGHLGPWRVSLGLVKIAFDCDIKRVTPLCMPVSLE